MFVIYHSSERFGSVTATSIVSLLENNRNMGKIHILYIEHGMTDATKSKIEQMVKTYGRTINFISMPNWNDELSLSLKSCKSGWLGFGYNRLFVEDLLPEGVDRVLYLDSDTIIEGDLSDLWNVEFNDCYLAGVDDCLSNSYKRIVEVGNDSIYCNAGVLMINLKKWRNDKLKEKFIDYIKERKGFFVFNEQTVINSVCQGKILILPCRYNVTSLVYSFTYNELMKLRRPLHYSYEPEEYYKSRQFPIITHFTGCFYIARRPWIQNSDHPHAKAYDRYYKLTPWSGIEYEKIERVTIWQKICKKIPKAMMISMVSFLYSYVRVGYFKIKVRKERK